MNARTLNRSLHPLLLCALAAWSCSHASVSQARELKFETRTAIVNFSDLNLSNPEGVAALYKRIKVAAHRLCEDRNAYTRRTWSKTESECKRQAIAKAVNDVHNDRLASVHRQATQWRDG
jgi:UrcA family protein